MLLTPIIEQLYVHSLSVANAYSFNQVLILFFLYAMMGWGLETAYRSFNQRRFFNPGFLKGPIVPLYGFAGLFIMVTIIFTRDAPVLIRLLIYFSSITIMEFFTGEVMLRLFKRRFWDYSHNSLNIRGHVCLPFSIAWAVLSLVFELTIHPFSITVVAFFEDYQLMLLNGAGLLIVQVDVIYSVGFRHPGCLNDARKRSARRLRPLVPGALLPQQIFPQSILKRQLERIQSSVRQLERLSKWMK